MVNINTIQGNLNKLLEPYNIQATASILKSEIKIVLAIPRNCTINFRDVRQLVMNQLSESALDYQKIVKIYRISKGNVLESESSESQPITLADIRSEIFRSPNHRILNQKEIRQYICQDWFTALQDL